ncbi:MAG: hypothetical protein ACP5FR_01065, partial [Candidatus Micrarchaeia archaeon]
MKALFVPVFIIAIFAMLGMANATLSYVSNTITTPIDYPQNAIYTINDIYGGVLPYTFNVYVTNSNAVLSNTWIGSNTFSPGTTNAIIITINSMSTNSLQVTAYNGVQSSANTLFSNTISTGTSNTVYGAWTFNAFFVDSTGANTIASSNTLTIYPQPSVTLTPSNTVLDSGQTETYTIAVYNGKGPFNVELYNISSGSKAKESNVTISSPGGSNTISFTVNSPTSSNTFEYNAIVTDQGTSTHYVFN